MRSIIEATNGRFFTIVYRKRDDTIRNINCRTGVVRYVKGTGLPRKNAGLITIYDVKLKGYRSININRIVAMKFAGAEIVPM